MSGILFRLGRARLLAYATVLVAFLLRAYRLADKNIWWDEGWSLWLSRQDLAGIALRTAADEHPPLHYWLLHFWNMFAGSDVFSGRFLSVIFAVLTIALIYRIGRRTGGVLPGILAALFLGLARFHVWWSQDIKNYTPSIFFAFAAVWFVLEILEQAPSGPRPFASSNPSVRNRLKPIIGYSLCAALALWTHYLTALVLLALNLYALIAIARSYFAVRRPPSALWEWLVANVIAAALFVPWMQLYLQNAVTWTAAPTFDFGLFIRLVATVLPLGVTTNIENYAALTIALTVLAVLGCIPRTAAAREPGNEQNTGRLSAATLSPAPGLFALIVVLPPVLIYILSLTPASFFAPKIQARYLLILLPAYILLLASGIDLLRRYSSWLALAVTLFAIAANVFVLNDYYGTRRLRDEYTTLTNTVNSFARQRDLVLLDTDQEWPTFLYYLRAPLEWLGVPNGKTMDAPTAAATVKRLLARSDAVWLVLVPDALATDPQRLLEARLADELPKRYEQTFGDKRLALYAREERDLVQVPEPNLSIQHPLGPIQFSQASGATRERVDLIGFDLPVRQAQVGDAVRVVTYWNGPATQGQLQIADQSQQPVESVAFKLPGGKNVRMQNDLAVPPNALAGTYTIRVLAGEKTVDLSTLQIEPRPKMDPVVGISRRVEYRLGEAIHLVGYDLPNTKFRAAGLVSITLYWRAERPVEKSYTVFVHIVGTQFNLVQNSPLWGQVDRIPRDGSYPTMTWLPDEVVPDAYTVKIDPGAPPGEYTIEVGLYDLATGNRLAVEGGTNSINLAKIEIGD